MNMVEVRLADGSIVSVRYPKVPPAPQIDPARRRRLASDWLAALSQAPTDQRIEELAPLVGRFPPRSRLGRIASMLVAGNRLPTVENVVEAHLHRQAVWQQRHIPAERVPEATRATIMQLIEDYQTEHGTGPAWSWLGAQVGLDRASTAGVLRAMRRDGQVTFTREPGSLSRASTATARS